MNHFFLLLHAKINSPEFAGYCGAMLAMVSSTLDSLNAGIQITASLGGLVLLFLGIWHKHIQIERDRKELKNRKNEKNP